MSHKSALIEVVNYKYDFDPNFDIKNTNFYIKLNQMLRKEKNFQI